MTFRSKTSAFIRKAIDKARLVALWVVCILLFPFVAVYAVWFFATEFGISFFFKE